MYMLGSQAH